MSRSRSLPARFHAGSRTIVAALLLAALALAAPTAGFAQPPLPWVPDELLVGFHDDVSEADAEDAYRGHGAAKLEKLHALRVHRVRVPPAALEAIERKLARDPRVEFVERNHVLSPDLIPDDPFYSSQWHLPKISAPLAWNLTTGASSVVIAILDTGVDGTHPDLAAKMVAGYNFYSHNTDTRDVHGHGTKVAGAAAASGDNEIGVAGVSWKSRIMPIRVSDAGGFAYYSTIASGLTWAKDHGARVMNVSFGGVAASSAISSAAQYVRSRGGVVVAAAGNCGCFDSTPANSNLISVSATTSGDALASWSSRGNYVDVAAPGSGIWTTSKGGGYASVSGTSFASPITAGGVALIMAAKPGLSAAEVEALVKANADDKGTTGWDSSFGFGRVNAYRAVAAALGSSATPPAPPGATITIDNGAPGTSRTGQWCVSSASNSYGSGSLYSCGSGTDTYRWTPSLGTADTYDVYVWWSTYANRSTSVPISVTHTGGTTKRTFNERIGGGQWVLHGRYSFAAGTAGYVQTSDANGQAAADAVRFVPAP
jgi:thermitase